MCDYYIPLYFKFIKILFHTHSDTNEDESTAKDPNNFHRSVSESKVSSIWPMNVPHLSSKMVILQDSGTILQDEKSYCNVFFQNFTK